MHFTLKKLIRVENTAEEESERVCVFLHQELLLYYSINGLVSVYVCAHLFCVSSSDKSTHHFALT